MTELSQVANPWLETFRLLAHATAGDDVDWHCLAHHAVDSLTALPQCPAALVWLWGDPPELAARVVAPDWIAAHAPAAVLCDALRRLPDCPPVPLELGSCLAVTVGPSPAINGVRLMPLVVEGETAGVVVMAEEPQSQLTPLQRAALEMIQDGLQSALHARRNPDALARADMQAVDLLAAAEDLMNLQATSTEGFDTLLQALATGLHLDHGLLFWAPHDGPWTLRAAIGSDRPLDADGEGLPEELASREPLLQGGGPPEVVVDMVLPLWGLRPRWALRFGCEHRFGGKGLALLGVAATAPLPEVRPGEPQLAATLTALASAAVGTLAVREAARRTSIQAVQALAQAVDAKDHYTHMHSRSVATLAAIIARRLGLSPEAVERARLAGLLHDVGKIGIPDAILNKPGPLNPVETLQMRQHPALGDHITKTIDSLQEIAPLVRAHHERWDGTGYPDRLAGEHIPLEARIVSAVDAYDAMTSDRVYRPGRPVALAADELLRQRGTQFDPRVVDALVSYIRERLGEAPPEAAA
jgi:putative nucleotidyltransferase with HDIG domain